MQFMYVIVQLLFFFLSRSLFGGNCCLMLCIVKHARPFQYVVLASVAFTVFIFVLVLCLHCTALLLKACNSSSIFLGLGRKKLLLFGCSS